jgi:hypothetical protein
MAGFTNTIENAVLNHIFGRTTYTASLGSRTIVGRSSFSANWR